MFCLPDRSGFRTGAIVAQHNGREFTNRRSLAVTRATSAITPTFSPATKSAVGKNTRWNWKFRGRVGVPRNATRAVRSIS